MTATLQRTHDSQPRLQERRPPGPKGWPLLGSLVEMGRDMLGFLEDSARRYGDVVAFRMAGWPSLLLNDPDDIEYVLVRNHENFVKNSFFWRQVTAIFGTGLLTSEGEFWRRQRRLAAPAFSASRLNAYGEVMVRHAERMLDGWQPGQIRNVHADMMVLTLGIAAKTLFDAEVEEDVAEIDYAVEALTNEIAARSTRPFLIPDAVPLPGHIRYRRGLRIIDRAVARMIAERRAKPKERIDFLSMLMAARGPDGAPMSDRQLRDEAVTLLLAGHETTALALSWTFYLLGQHPEVDAELAAELNAVLGGRNPAVADLPRLRFTEQVVTEAMRLFPPAWGIGRESVSDCEIGGYPVAAGTTIFISPWLLHRDPRFFERPTEFRPERWGGDFAKTLPRFAYMPFGGGPRICIGNRFAMMEAVLILATVARRFRVEWQRDRPVVPFPSITLRPKGGVWAKLAPRR